MEQDDKQAALKAYEVSRDIRVRLAGSDPGNAGWQWSLSINYFQIGIVQMSQGNLQAALEAFEASLNIRTRLAASNPDNAEWQRNLSMSLEAVGKVQELLAKTGSQP